MRSKSHPQDNTVRFGQAIDQYAHVARDKWYLRDQVPLGRQLRLRSDRQGL